MVIYLFIFPNQKYYVGRTVDFKQRLSEHKYATDHENPQLVYKALRKYGWNNVEKLVLENCSTLEELIEREAYYINKYNSVEEGYNLTTNTRIGGDNWQGLYTSEKYKDFQFKMKSINSGTSNGMYGREHTLDSKNKMKEKAKGRHSLEWFITRYGDQQGTSMYEARCKNKAQKSTGAQNASYKKINLQSFKSDVLTGMSKVELCKNYGLVSTAFTNKLKECFNDTSLYRIRSNAKET